MGWGGGGRGDSFKLLNQMNLHMFLFKSLILGTIGVECQNYVELDQEFRRVCTVQNLIYSFVERESGLCVWGQFGHFMFYSKLLIYPSLLILLNLINLNITQ